MVLPIVSAVTKVGNVTRLTNSLIDQGSSCTMTTQEFAEEVDAILSEPKEYDFSTVDRSVPSVWFPCTSLQIHASLYNGETYQLNEVIVKPELNIPMSCKAIMGEIAQYPHLSDIVIPETEATKVEILFAWILPIS